MGTVDIRHHPRLLLVEGEDDKRIVPWLMERSGIPWETSDGHGVLVGIRAPGSYEAVKELIALELKPAMRRVVGAIVDADRAADDRWKSLRTHCLATVEGLEPSAWPVTPLAEGLVIDFEPPEGPRRPGVWIMPDNRSAGMLESFLQQLSPKGSSPELRALAEKSSDEAHELGAPYKPAHRDKAIIHTWLAWQDPPGRQLHDAIKQRQLDPTAPLGQAFARWFRRLYGLSA